MSSSYSSTDGLGADELRAAVRAVLQDVLRDELSHGARVRGAATLEHLVVRNDADLDALVRRVAALCEDPSRRAALRDGRHGFRLADGSGVGGPAARQASNAVAGVVRVERGAVTERTVAQVAADGARLVLGPKAVLTPLARDKARVLGVEIEKER